MPAVSYNITTENARQLAAKSWAPTSARFQPKLESAPKQPLQPTLQYANSEVQADIVRVRKRLDELDKFMSAAANNRKLECPHCEAKFELGPDSREWDNLSRSYERLFRVWMVLTGTPGSGQRASIRGGSSVYPLPEVVVEPAAAPQPVANCGVPQAAPAQPAPQLDASGSTPDAAV